MYVTDVLIVEPSDYTTEGEIKAEVRQEMVKANIVMIDGIVVKNRMNPVIKSGNFQIIIAKK